MKKMFVIFIMCIVISMATTFVLAMHCAPCNGDWETTSWSSCLNDKKELTKTWHYCECCGASASNNWDCVAGNSCWGCSYAHGGICDNGDLCTQSGTSKKTQTYYYCPGTNCTTPCNPNTVAGCNASCNTQPNVCGNGNVETGEECDDNCVKNYSLTNNQLDADDMPSLLNGGRIQTNKRWYENDMSLAQLIDLKFEGNTTKGYNYTLLFESPVQYETDEINRDLRGGMINMHGKEYIILDAKHTNRSDGLYNRLDRLRLMETDTVLWIKQGQIFDYNAHDIELIDVSTDARSCGFKIDGTQIWIDAGETENIAGFNIGVLEAKTVISKNYDQDICKFALGSHEIEIRDDAFNYIEVNEDRIEGASVHILGTAQNDVGYWLGLIVSYDQLPSTSFTDPIFGSFNLRIEGDYYDISMPDCNKNCPADTIVCPDGTTVGRTGSNCEFVCPKIECIIDATCPSETEQYCDGNNTCTKTISSYCINGVCEERAGSAGCKPCPNGCQDGICKKESPTLSCSETDDGLDYFKKGRMDLLTAGGTKTDFCSGSKLTEYYCDDCLEGTPCSYVKTYTCPHGCEDGACIREVREYAPAYDVNADNRQVLTLSDYKIKEQGNKVFTNRVTVSMPGGYIYKEGYYLTGTGWKKFTFDETTIYDSNWIADRSTKRLKINTRETGFGVKYIAVYACKKYDGEWKCGCDETGECGKWMIISYDVEQTMEFPPEPTIPRGTLQ